MQNIALNRPATQSSTSPWSTSPRVEIDARIANNGDVRSAVYFHTMRELNPWWQVDLEQHYLLTKIVIYNRADYPGRLAHFTILRSDDGEYWHEAYRKSDHASVGIFTIDIKDECLARYVRVRLDGVGILHFRECEVYGKLATDADRTRLQAADAIALKRRTALPEGRSGRIAQLNGLHIFVDDAYSPAIKRAIESGKYEGRERKLVAQFLTPSDRVIEVGTAVGAVAMTAASIVGAQNVATYDANPDIVRDARDNFRRNAFEDIESNVAVLANKLKFREGMDAEFHISRNFWASRLASGPKKGDIVRIAKVPVRCLEQEIERRKATVLICDIEGGEVELLTASDLRHIRLIILETHYWSAGEEPVDAMMRNLIEQGFSLHLGASGEHVSVLRR